MHPYFQKMEPGAFYHIYNRGNNGERIFFTPQNFTYFLKKIGHYLLPYVDIYCYCLLSNHFHLLVKIKSEIELLMACQSQLPNTEPHAYSSVVSEQFRRFFLAYAKAIKEQEGRTGSLFEKNFRRKLITDDTYAICLINYIHRNPETHGLVPDFRRYPHSSYHALLSAAPTRLKRKEVLALFGGSQAFVTYHEEHPVRQWEEGFE